MTARGEGAAPHRFPVRVWLEDTDAGGVAYHASHLRWAERARTEALREAGLAHAALIAEDGLFLVVRNLEVRYCRAARLDAQLVVETAVRRVGGASVRLAQAVRDGDGRMVADLAVTLACVARDGLRPAPLPPRLRAALAGLARRDGDDGNGAAEAGRDRPDAGPRGISA